MPARRNSEPRKVRRTARVSALAALACVTGLTAGACRPADRLPPPHADAGPSRAVAYNATVTLDGTASTAAQGALTYLWHQTAGPVVTLSDPSAATTTFVAFYPGAYVFTLTVTDEFDRQDTDEVTIAGLPPDPPVAEAGADQTVPVGATVTLDGTGSTAHTDTVYYLWRKDAGPDATLADATAAKTTFVANNAGVYQFTLFVRDAVNQEVFDQVQVTAGP